MLHTMETKEVSGIQFSVSLSPLVSGTHPSGSQDQAQGTVGMRLAGHGHGFWPHP